MDAILHEDGLIIPVGMGTFDDSNVVDGYPGGLPIEYGVFIEATVTYSGGEVRIGGVGPSKNADWPQIGIVDGFLSFWPPYGDWQKSTIVVEVGASVTLRMENVASGVTSSGIAVNTIGVFMDSALVGTGTNGDDPWFGDGPAWVDGRFGPIGHEFLDVEDTPASAGVRVSLNFPGRFGLLGPPVSHPPSISKFWTNLHMVEESQ